MSRDKYLLRKYGIDDKEYNRMLAAQGGVCLICEKKHDGRLHVDHDHSLARVKIRAAKIAPKVWVAGTIPPPKRPWLRVQAVAETKPQAIQKLRAALLKLSVRGLLTWDCNRLLQRGRDKPGIFRACADYLDQHEQHLREQICAASPS